jgi:hypothetical protein
MALPLIPIFMAIGGIFKKIMSVIAEFFIFLFKNPKILLALLVAIAILFSYYKVTKHIRSLDNQIVKLEEEKAIWKQAEAIYESNQKQMTQINRENQQVLDALQVSKIYWGKNVVDLKKANEEAEKKLGQIIDNIKNAPPEKDGAVAPVLKSTVKEIDESRKERNKLWQQK